MKDSDGLNRMRLYRSRQVAGLLIVAGAVLAFALARANWHEIFPAGWWRF